VLCCRAFAEGGQLTAFMEANSQIAVNIKTDPGVPHIVAKYGNLITHLISLITCDFCQSMGRKQKNG
jgi:hypothetical protein